MSDNKKNEAMKYLETHVNLILKPLMMELVKKKPEKVCDSIIDWVNN